MPLLITRVWFQIVFDKHFERLANGLGTPEPLVFFDGDSEHKFDVLKSDELLIWVITLISAYLHIHLKEIPVNSRLRQLSLENVRSPDESGKIVASDVWESAVRG